VIELTKAMKKLIAESLIAVGGALDGCKVMLFSNNIVPDENTTFADLVPCAYTGYADSDVVVWGDPYVDGDSGEWALSCPPVEFRSTAGSPYVSDLAYGYAVYLPGTPNVLRFAERFDEYQGFPVADSVLVVRPELIGLGGDSVIAS
jgi:hypothetical protein